jgi:hypothetical protein
MLLRLPEPRKLVNPARAGPSCHRWVVDSFAMRNTATDSLIAEEYRKRLQRTERGYRDPEYKPDASLDFDPARSGVQLIAYYLPQFHLIPENEEAWGRGFTEWTNVTRAVPQFADHYQPHLPGDLGFYDLSNEETLERQVALARKYGISGFCIHYYWFGGKRLLEKPVATLYRRNDLDIRFCLCWANETWSRRWDGSEAEVLIPQVHTPESEKEFIEDAVRYMDDPRYLMIDQRPVLVIYRSELLVDPERTLEHWRNVALKSVGKDLFLLRAMTFKPVARVNGFDAAVQFPPHDLDPGVTSVSKALFNAGFSGHIYDYAELLQFAERQFREYDFPFIPAVMTGWDNTPRRGGAGTCFHGSTPAHYAAWLTKAAAFARQKPIGGSSCVFINAWNEWGEGAHLEPDQKFGHAYLRATAEVLRPYCEIEARSRGAPSGDASPGIADQPSNAPPAPMPALPPRRCILVAGMHRSGTSATTRVINLLGADIASDLVEGIPGDNDRGFWESAATYTLHDRLFAALDSAWDDPYPLPDGWRETDAAREAKRAIHAHIDREFADSKTFVVKDPRITRVLALWLDVLDQLCIEPVVVIPFRNPVEIALSLERRDRLPLAQSLLCYIQGNLEVERASRGRRRIFHLYDDLISDWRSFAEKLANIGGPDGKALNPAVAGELDRFLSPELRRHKAGGANFASLPAGAATLAELHDRLQQAASSGDETSLRACFDRIRERMWDAPRLFRAVAAARAEAHRGEIARLQANTTAKIQRLEAELDELDDRERRLKAADADLRRLMREVKDRDLRLEAADADLRRLTGEVEDCQRRLTVADVDLRRLLGEIEDRECKLVVADVDMRRLMREAENRDQQLRRLTAEIGERGRQLVAANEDRLRLIREIDDRDRRLEAANDELLRILEKADLDQRHGACVLTEHERQLVLARQALDALAEDVRERDQRLMALGRRLHEIEMSTTWRITAPVRKLFSGWRRALFQPRA